MSSLPSNGNLLIRYLLRELMGLVVMALALFWSAGNINWWPAWAALAVMSGWIIVTAVIVIWYNPELLAERLGPREGAKRWDIAIMGFVGLIQLTRYIIAGLDQRFGWSTGIPFAAQIAALFICILGYCLVIWATAANKFFSQIVRIQAERGHTVATGGPYHFIRHPAYTGAILYELAVPILLASWWAFLISILNLILLLIRTAMEDKVLQSELIGYHEYTEQVRYRLLPGVW